MTKFMHFLLVCGWLLVLILDIAIIASGNTVNPVTVCCPVVCLISDHVFALMKKEDDV